MPTTRKKKGKPASNDKDNNTNTNGDKIEDTNQPVADTNTTDKEEGDSITNNKVPDNSEKKDQDNSPILPKDPTKKRKQLRFDDSEEDDFGNDGRRTLTTRPELTLKRVYHGGTDLNGFEREFCHTQQAH